MMPEARNIHRPRRGFAVLTAIVLTAVVGVAMAAALSVFRTNLRRTARIASDAQLRQLLVAGERVARARLASTGPGAGQDAPVDLPAALSQDGAALRVDAAGAPTAGNAAFHVTATLGGRRASQTLQYANRAGGWVLARAELEPFQSDPLRRR